MNTFELYDRVKSYTGRDGRTARWDRNRHLDNFINVAIDAVVKDRYDNIKKNRRYSFDVFSRIKAELYTIVRRSASLNNALNGRNYIAVLPTDYLYEAGVEIVYDDGTRRFSENLSFNEMPSVSENSLKRPTKEYPGHLFHSGGMEVQIGGDGVISLVLLDYLVQPHRVSSGVEITNATATTIGLNYYVNTGSITMNTVVYTRGQVFIADDVVFTGSGTLISYVDTDLPVALHEEICKVAAGLLMESVNNFSKGQALAIQNAQS